MTDLIYYVEPTPVSFTSLRLSNTAEGVKIEFMDGDIPVWTRVTRGPQFDARSHLRILISGNVVFSSEG